MRASIRTIVTMHLVCLWSSIALACPFCDSQTAEQVRAAIFNEDFVYHLAAAFAPLPVFLGILALIYFGD